MPDTPEQTSRGAGEPAAVGPGGLLPPAGEPERYRALSGLALVGFAVAAVYSVLTILGWVVSFFFGSPWLLPAWTLIIPVGAALVCWAARNRIRDSEGTLSGEGLASWGVGLSAIVGLVYAAYFAGTLLAVRAQATAFAENWLDLVRAGDLETTFVQTLRPPQPKLDEGGRRQTLEINFNQPPEAGRPGPYSQFCSSPIVRLLRQGGDESTWTLSRITTPTYVQGGYQVDMVYRVTTPAADADVSLTVRGVDPTTAEFSGRQWQVVLEQSGLGTPTITEDAGKELQQATAAAAALAYSWMDKLHRPDGSSDWHAAFLDTLEPGQRQAMDRVGKQQTAVAALAGPAALLAGGPEAMEYATARAAFFGGGLLRMDEKRFWAQNRQAIEGEVNRLFKPTDPHPRTIMPQSGRGGPGTWLMLDPSPLPTGRKVNGRVEIPFSMVAAVVPAFVVEGQLILSAKAEDANKPAAWRIDRIDVERARQVADRPGPGGPGGPRVAPGG